MQLWTQSFKFIERESHQIGPSYISDNVGLSEESEHETYWIHNRRVFLRSLTPAERNILVTGEPDLKFDPFTYI